MWQRQYWESILLVIIPLMVAGCQLGLPDSTPLPTATTQEMEPAAMLTRTPGPASVEGFEQFAIQVRERPQNERQGIVSRYMVQIGSTPLIEENDAIFIYRGGGYEVQLVGDMNNWNMAEAPNLIQLEGTDLWYIRVSFETTARLDYQFWVNQQTLHMDPNNPTSMAGPLGPNSVIKMPAYLTPAELLPFDDHYPQGTLTTKTIESQYLNQTKTFVVYIPPGQIVGRLLPSVYINDGHDFLNLIDAPALLDKLIEKRIIPPMVAIFILPINRDVEYTQNNSYVQFLTQELVPFIQSNYDTDPDPERTAILGSSIGANAALFSAFRHPDVFGLVSAFSPAINPEGDPLTAALANMGQSSPIEDQTSQRFRSYIEVGTYETDVDINGNRMNLLAGNRQLPQVLRSAGNNLTYEERPEGHSWGLWQAAFGRSLADLFNR